jgi:hypothetical protein
MRGWMLIVTRAKEAVAAMIKRLAHRNANVQLYTLEVCIPLFESCELRGCGVWVY